MRLKSRITGLSAGGPLIAVLNHKDAIALGVTAKSRVNLKSKNCETTAIADISYGSTIKQGEVWLFEELAKELKVKGREMLKATAPKTPDSIALIKKKMDNCRLTKSEMNEIIKDLVKNRLTEIEATAFVSACYINKMTLSESAYLAEAIVNNSGKLKFKRHPIVDKHCIGGIPGNRTTMIVVPILAAAGLTIPKTSTRSITSPSGTADTMEVLAPVSHSKKKIMEIVNKTNGCMVWGGALELASADDKLIKIEKPLNLDPEGILLASILSKKSAADASHVLIDIPVGPEAKIKTIKDAKHLKSLFIKLGKRLGLHIDCIITNGTQPIGNGIGPALEARDVLEVLQGNGPKDLRRKSLILAAKILRMVKVKRPLRVAVRILDFKLAEAKMREIIKEQGGNPNIKPKEIAIGLYEFTKKSASPGIVTGISNKAVSAIAKMAGAPTDKGAGIYLHKKLRDHVSKGEKLYTLYAETKIKLEYAKEISRERKIMEVS